MTTVELADNFTSRGNKFFNHPEALEGLRNGKPRPVVTHLMLTDICQHKCAFCSVQTRDGNSLSPAQITDYIRTLKGLGLKAVILSGGGNPILYKSPGGSDSLPKWDFNDVVDFLHSEGLEIGLITNGMPMRDYVFRGDPENDYIRSSWRNVTPETLDKLTWIRISMSGLDHPEGKVFVPDIDERKTTLGFSYVAHDSYEVPAEPNHGKVSTEYDLKQYGKAKSVRRFEDRIKELTDSFTQYVTRHNPRYLRLLPNCLEPELIDKRCEQLREIANAIDPSIIFVQHKPPQAPPACFLGYLHPVLNSDGYVYPCDSCVLNRAADHKFAEPWRICRWDQIGLVYSQPARSLINRPEQLCPGCVFTKSNVLLTEIANGRPLDPPTGGEHPNFI